MRINVLEKLSEPLIKVKSLAITIEFIKTVEMLNNP